MGATQSVLHGSDKFDGKQHSGKAGLEVRLVNADGAAWKLDSSHHLRLGGQQQHAYLMYHNRDMVDWALQGFRLKKKHGERASLGYTDVLSPQRKPSNGSSTAAEHAAAKQSDKPTKAASFLAWAKRQSKQRNKTLRQFLVESAQLSPSTAGLGQDKSSSPSDPPGKDLCQHSSDDTLGLQDVLRVLTAEQQQHQQQQQQAPKPFEPHDGYVQGAPKPHCHEARVVAADGIQALRRTRDGELGEYLRKGCFGATSTVPPGGVSWQRSMPRPCSTARRVGKPGKVGPVHAWW
jgi:hypothetical protein